MRTLVGDLDEAVALLEQLAAMSPDPESAVEEDNWWWRDLQDHPGFQRLVGSSN